METSTPPVRHLLTILAVDDPARAAAFYRGVFGWELEVDVPVFVQLRISEGRGLGLYERKAFSANTGLVPDRVDDAAITATELYLHCHDVPGVMARLREHGARELSPLALRPWGEEVAYYRDPDGNVLAIARPAAI